MDQFDDEELITLAKNQLINVYVRQFAYSVFMNDTENSTKIRSQILSVLDDKELICKIFQNQVKYFTPLIFHAFGWPRLEKFIRQLKKERESFIEQCPERFDDRFDLLEAAIWCAKFDRKNQKSIISELLKGLFREKPSFFLTKRGIKIIGKYLLMTVSGVLQ